MMPELEDKIWLIILSFNDLQEEYCILYQKIFSSRTQDENITKEEVESKLSNLQNEIKKLINEIDLYIISVDAMHVKTYRKKIIDYLLMLIEKFNEFSVHVYNINSSIRFFNTKLPVLKLE